MRLSIFPSAHDKELSRWYSDDAHEERRYDYDLSNDSLVLDLGGYKGQWASDIYARYNCQIFVLEPVKSFAKQIAKRFARNPKVKVFCVALGAKTRQVVIGLNNDGSSVYRRSGTEELVQFEDVAEFFHQHNILGVDLMKVNIEGGEYELLPRMVETGLIQRIKHLQIQFHDIEPGSEASMKEIRRQLSNTHRPIYQYQFVWESWTRSGS